MSALGARSDEPLPDRSREVLDAAAWLFARSGYHGAGVREIAQRVGMKAGSLYFHLKSKDEALEAVCAYGLKASLRYSRRALEAGPELSSQLRALLRAQAEELKQDGDYVATYLTERRHLTPEARERIASLNQEYRSFLDQLFQNAQARGELRPDVDVRAASLITAGLLRNLSQLYTQGPIRGFDDFVRDSAEVLVRGLSPVPARPRRSSPG